VTNNDNHRSIALMTITAQRNKIDSNEHPITTLSDRLNFVRAKTTPKTTQGDQREVKPTPDASLISTFLTFSFDRCLTHHHIGESVKTIPKPTVIQERVMGIEPTTTTLATWYSTTELHPLGFHR